MRLLVPGPALTLIVESHRAAAYLETLWAEPRIRVLSLGAPGVAPLVEAARADGHTRVYGLTGRGFGSENRHRWARPPADLHTYVAPVFDLEAYLVGPHDPSPTPDLCRWMAGRHLLADTARAATAALPTEGTADSILASGWFGTVARDLGELADPDWVKAELARLEAWYGKAPRTAFPGAPFLAGVDEEGARTRGHEARGSAPPDLVALLASLLAR